MPSILHILAACYAEAEAGRRGGARDFLIDYEKLLRLAGMADGDERELAEAELAVAAREAAGWLVIDRDPRSGLPQNVRLAREGGEAGLFHRLGMPSPAVRREALAAEFETAAAREVPATWRQAWRDWCAGLADAARTGGSVQPFKRGDGTGTAALLEAIAGVLNWQGESLLPYASAVICGDSKRLRALEGRVVQGLAAVTGATSLEEFGILEKPRGAWIHGPLSLDFADGGRVDLTALPGAVALSESNLVAACGLRTPARVCLTVENEAVFLELVKRNPGILLVWTSFAGAGVLRLLEMLPAGLEWRHFGDTDPAGFDILRDLRERSGRPLSPFLMDPCQTSAGDGTPFDARDRQTLARLVDAPVMADLRPVLERYLAGGIKGRFEQELVPLERVLAELTLIGPPAAAPHPPDGGG